MLADRVVGLGRGDEVGRGPAAFPGGSTDRTRAARWCPARRTGPGRSRNRRGSPSRSTRLAVALHVELLEIGRRSGAGTGRRAARRSCRRSGNWRSRRRSTPAAAAGCIPAARCGNARPSRGRRPASPRNCPCRWRSRSAGRSRTTGGTAADPVPEHEHVCRIDAELAPPPRWSKPRRSAWRPPFRRPRFAGTSQRAVWALASVSCVVKVLRGDDEQRGRRIALLQRLGHVGAVDVGDEVHPQVRAADRASTPRDAMYGAEVGAADADIHDIGDLPAVMAASRRRRGQPGRTPASAPAPALTSGMTSRAVHQHRAVGAIAQRGVQHRAALRAVDLLAREHAVAPACHILPGGPDRTAGPGFPP